MKNYKIGQTFQIQCYKHNGTVHRAWDEAVLLDCQKDYMVFGNNRTQVIEAEGSTWRTKEPAIMYFFKNKWFNIIAQLKKDGIYYYCNIATPYIIEEQTIKYIDYDLDLRIFPSGEYKILDRLEYKYHKKIMHYSEQLDRVIKMAMDQLIQDFLKHSPPFQVEKNLYYYQIYKKQKQTEKKSHFSD